MATRIEILKDTLGEYLKASKEEKGVILDRLEQTVHMHRKAIVRRLRELQLKPEAYYPDKRGRNTYYTHDVTAALKEVWEMSGELCAERLHPILPEYVACLVRDGMWKHGDDTTGKLQAMSMGTMKDRVGTFPRVLVGGGRSTTKPSELKELIPIRRGPWENPPPGTGEIDSVVHCGHTLIGDYAYTVQYTDVSTLWCMLEGQWNKGQEETVASLERMRERIPFPLLQIDPDTGTEFINWHAKGWCDEQGILMTRIRPGHKNDHGRIEQKNFVNVRKWSGYLRYDDKAKLRLLKELYVVLEIYVNHFVPSQKCVRKEVTEGKKYRRIYDMAQTPYQRVLAHPLISNGVKARLMREHATYNPKVLHDKVMAIRKKLFAGAKREPK